METRPLMVVGHKNPDTDSVCSAIAYARLKSLIGEPAKAFRAGNINAQTKYVLERFGAETPPLLTDAFLRISDIMIGGGELISLKPTDPVGHARDVMLERRFSFLPVTDDEGHCLGKFTILGLAGALEQIRKLSDGVSISFYPAELLRRMNGWGGAGAPTVFSGKLRLPRASGELAARGAVTSGSGTLFVLSESDERPEAGPGDLILLCGAVRESGHNSTAHELFVPGTPVDVLVALYEASPLREQIESAEPLLKSNELVRRAEREINRYNAGGFIVTDDDGVMKGVITRVNFLNQAKFRLALVDHNEMAQAVDGAEQADIVEVIDHHRLGARGTDAPITFINKVVGSTCTIVAEMYRNRGLIPDRETAGLMLSALLSDTVILKSPTATDLDRDIAPWLASIAEVAIDTYGEDMFAAGSELSGLKPEAIVGQDQKLYEESGFKFAVSQIEMVGFKGFYERSEELAEALELSRSQIGCHFACLLVTDITRETSLLLYAGNERVADAVQYPRAGAGLFEMNGILSRKKQLLPYFLDLLKNL